MTLEGRVAMVTGGGRGIGAAIAARLARLGASVAVCDLDATTAQSTAAALPANGLAVRMDVSSSAEVVDAVARIGDELGPIDLLVNNAGFDVIEPFMDSAEETWDRLWQVNLKGQIICCQAVLAAHMIPNQRGRIVNIGSDAGRVGSTGEAVYSHGRWLATRSPSIVSVRDRPTPRCSRSSARTKPPACGAPSPRPSRFAVRPSPMTSRRW
jgi:2-hydroxycyclohexanecarboxyl-CoA dehydrogenase